MAPERLRQLLALASTYRTRSPVFWLLECFTLRDTVKLLDDKLALLSSQQRAGKEYSTSLQLENIQLRSELETLRSSRGDAYKRREKRKLEQAKEGLEQENAELHMDLEREQSIPIEKRLGMVQGDSLVAEAPNFQPVCFYLSFLFILNC